MTTKNLVILGAAAVVLGGAAWYCNSGRAVRAPSIVGEKILPSFDVADDKGWKLQSLYGYPADVTKIRENLLKLTELKVGQVANGKKLASPATVDIQNAAGKSLAALPLGETHTSKPKGQAAMYGGGGYPDGRYLAFEGETVLVKDTLDAFDGDAKKWCNPRIASIPSSDVMAVKFAHGGATVALEKGTNSTWVLKGLGPKEELDTSKTYSLDSALSYLDFSSIADPKLTEAVLGFSTGYFYTVTMMDGSNTVTHVATIGNKVKDGSDRYFKLDDGKWVFTISSYSAESMMKARKDLVKAKEEPKKDEAKKDDTKPKVEAKKDAPKKAEIRKAEAKPKPKEEAKLPAKK